MRRAFSYSTCQPSEANVRADITRIVKGHPIKSVVLRPWDMGGFHVSVVLDLPETVEQLLGDVRALASELAAEHVLTVERSGPFADLSWKPLDEDEVFLAEYVAIDGPERFACIAKFSNEYRFFAGPRSLTANAPCLMDSEAELRRAVTRVLDYMTARSA
ncbi:MAG: hypothetical protein KF878_04350 [Planctomycetes bacterium]|nr:hypothetical protein [Planctomycetota bacterium]